MRIRNFLLTCSVILIGLGLVDPVSAQTLGNVATAAGLGPSSGGFSGDGGLATAAKLYYPSGVAFDAAGNMYIADNNNYRIRKVDTSGIITTLAGTGSGAETGDNGPATAATIMSPYKVAVDGSGNVYVADYQANRVRKINTAGVITTFAGTGTGSYSGDGGPATAATLYQPIDVAADSAGNVYIADSRNNCIRKVNTAGIISTVAGTGTSGYNGDNQQATSAQLNQPAGVAVDSNGNIYITDNNNLRVRKVDTSGIITTLAGTGSSGYSGDGGPATSATIRGSYGVVADNRGNVYISDTNNQCIRKVDSSGIITTVAGVGQSNGYVNGTATSAKFYNARGIALGPDGNLYIADQGNHAVRVLYLSVPAATSLGTSPVAQATATTSITFSSLSGTASSFSMAYGTEFVLDPASCTSGANPSCNVTFTPQHPGLRQDALLAKDSSGHVIGTQYVYGIGQGPLPVVTPGIISTVDLSSVGTVHPIASVFDPAGNWYINDYPYNRIIKVATTGTASAITATGLGSAYLGNLACDGAGNLYSVTSDRNLVKIAGDGTTSAVASGLSFTGSIGQLAIATDGTFYVADVNGARVLKISHDGASVSTLSVSTALSNPTGLAFDNSGTLFISDPGNSQIVKVTTAGTASTLNPNNVLQAPVGLATDAAGNIYVADATKNQLFRIAPDTTTSVIAGTGMAGETGDGGLATSATIVGYGVAVGQDGTIYLGDRTNNVVRKIAGSKLLFNSTNVGTTSTQSASVTNIGNTAYLFFSPFTLMQNPSAYSVVSSGGIDCSTLASNSLGAGTSCAVKVQFAPTVAGAITDTLTLGTGLPILLNGVAPGVGTVSIPTTPLTFGTVTLGSASAPQTVPLTNSGTGTLNVVSLTVSGPNAADFVLTNNCAASLAPGASCNASLAFQPSVAGAESASFVVATADAVTNVNVPQTIALSGTGQSSTSASPQPSAPLRFVPVTPCRVLDTRLPAGPLGGPALVGGTARDLVMAGTCGLPANAQAYAVNVTVLPQSDAPLYVRAWPSGQAPPLAVVLNTEHGHTKANAAVVSAGTNGNISIWANQDTQAILDITGYFVPDATQAAFYPLAPCRAVDTRAAPGLLGAPMLAAQAARSFALAGICGLPTSGVTAYQLNVTVVPHGALRYLQLWASGAPQPITSLLNATSGTPVANAALVQPDSQGRVSAYAADDTDLIIDVSGYWAPSSSGGLSLYTLPPCRAFDSRSATPAQAMMGQQRLTVDPSCGAAVGAQAYLFNAEVLPQTGHLNYLQLWAEGGTQPSTSVLNAMDGATNSNLAVVPTTGGAIQAYTTESTHLVLDLYGYFAP